MRAWSRRGTWICLLAALACTACLGQTVPRRVVAGTTLIVPFASNLPTAELPTTYGADPALNAGTLLVADRQRGNARFGLCPMTGSCSSPRWLVLKYMGRVTPDRGSSLGRSGDLKVLMNGTPTTQATEGLTGQPVAVLDVPTATPPGTYQLTYFFRAPGASSDMSLPLQPLQVVSVTATSSFTDLTKALNLVVNGSMPDVSPSLQGFVPDPQLLLVLVDRMNDRPAAATLVLRHPPTALMQGAFEDGLLGQGSVVRMSAGPVANTVAITVVDPDSKVIGLRVAFQLAATATAPVTAADFSIESQALYAAGGAPIWLAPDASSMGNSFVIDPFIR
jgi:hypothetical protein